MRISWSSIVLLVFISLFFSRVSYSKEAEDCWSYIKSPDSIFCISSWKEKEIEQKILEENEVEVPIPVPVENALDNPEPPPNSTFFMEDENGEITDQPRVFNDFSDVTK